jgi:hypothetical protein
MFISLVFDAIVSWSVFGSTMVSSCDRLRLPQEIGTLNLARIVSVQLWRMDESVCTLCLLAVVEDIRLPQKEIPERTLIVLTCLLMLHKLRENCWVYKVFVYLVSFLDRSLCETQLLRKLNWSFSNEISLSANCTQKTTKSCHIYVTRIRHFTFVTKPIRKLSSSLKVKKYFEHWSSCNVDCTQMQIYVIFYKRLI